MKRKFKKKIDNLEKKFPPLKKSRKSNLIRLVFLFGIFKEKAF